MTSTELGRGARMRAMAHVVLADALDCEQIPVPDGVPSECHSLACDLLTTYIEERHAVDDRLAFESKRAQDALTAELSTWRARAEKAEALLNTPEILDFAKAVQLESAHQRSRWGSAHDEGKADADWFWLIGYLGGKALHNPDGDASKQLHRIITVAAAACNWHAAKLGQTNMRPGIATPTGEMP